MQNAIPLSVTLALILSSLLPAQTEPAQTGSLQGRVEDVTGTPIPEARVTLTHRATQADRKTSADETGHFECNELPLGGYLLKVRARGFEDVQVPVRIGAKPGAPVRIRLEVATLTEQVTVTGSATPV